MFCKKCGAQLDDDAQFCERCGSVIKRIAPATVQPNDDAAVGQDERVKESDSVPADDKESKQEVTVAETSEYNSGSKPTTGKTHKKSLIIAAIMTAVLIIAVRLNMTDTLCGMDIKKYCGLYIANIAE